MMSCATIARQMTFALSMLALLPQGVDAAPRPADSANSLDGLTVSFKLDPRVADPTHGGTLWISSHTYSGAYAQDTVQARAQAIDAQGRISVVGAKWVPTDPTMVKVSAGPDNEVRIAVKRAGQSKVKVIAGEVWQELLIQARYQGKFIQVAITQLRDLKAARSAPARPPPVLEASLAEKRNDTEVTLPSGLRFKILKRPDGPMPTDDDVVEVRYRVRAPNGKELEGSHSEEPVSLRVAEASWREALKLMSVGSRGQIVLPSKPLPPSDTPRGRKRSAHTSKMSVPLVVDVELLAINTNLGEAVSSPGGLPARVAP